MMEKEERKTPKILEKETSRRGFLKGAVATAGGVAALTTLGGLKPPAAKAAAPAKKPQFKYLFAERQNCTGCRACEYACSLKHEGFVRPSVSRIHVRKYFSVIDVPVICWHCDDAPCIKACPTTPKAIKKDPETNAIKYIDDKTCLGAKCNKCIEACPTSALKPYEIDIRRCLTYAAENPGSAMVEEDVRELERKLIRKPTLNSFIECTICQDVCPVG